VSEGNVERAKNGAAAGGSGRRRKGRHALRLGWRGRLVLAFLVLAGALVLTSAWLELTGIARLALDNAEAESRLITEDLVLQIDHVVQTGKGDPLTLIRDDPRIQLVLQAAASQASSVMFVAVCDSTGKALAHSSPEKTDWLVERNPVLPAPGGSAAMTRLILSMLHSPEVYQVETTLLMGERPLATIRVGLAGVFLREEMSRVLRRNLPVVLVELVLAIGVGFTLAAFATRKLRELGAGVAAMREGRFDRSIPESGIDEFDRLAHDLNLLGREIREKSEREDAQALSSSVMSRLSDMSAGVAHEVRNSLQRIRFELGEMAESTEGGGTGVGATARATLEEVERLENSVSGFLKVARLRQVSFDAVPLARLLEEVHKTLETEANLAGLDLELAVEGELPELHADRDVLFQALENLVRNAIQAQPSREGKVTIGAHRNGRSVEVSVSDTGPGIPAEIQGRIFDLYFTTKKDKGTGVGLTLVRHAIEMHGGELDVRSTPGTGTTFAACLPITERTGIGGETTS
jgi:signal transduction histidine kinase